MRTCPYCNRAAQLSSRNYPATVTCDNCYDGAPDSGARASLIGIGGTFAEAVADWNERVEDVRADLEAA